MNSLNQQKENELHANKYNRNLKRERSVGNAIGELGFMKVEGLLMTHGGREFEQAGKR